MIHVSDQLTIDWQATVILRSDPNGVHETSRLGKPCLSCIDDTSFLQRYMVASMPQDT